MRLAITPASSDLREEPTTTAPRVIPSRAAPTCPWVEIEAEANGTRGMNTGTLILCYHRVAEGVDDPFRLCVSPGNFAAQLEELGRVAEPSTLDDVGRPSRKRRVVVTFDDGYGDNLWNAEPIARAKGVPITVFVTSGKIDDARGMWWDQLGALLRHRPAGTTEVRLSLPSGPVMVPLGSEGDQRTSRTSAATSCPCRWPRSKGSWPTWAGNGRCQPSPPTTPACSTSTEFDDLAAADVVTIGAHTADHLRLRGQPGEAQSRSVAASKEALEAARRVPCPPLRLSLRRPRRLRRHECGCRAPGGVRHRLHHRAGIGRCCRTTRSVSLVASLPIGVGHAFASNCCAGHSGDEHQPTTQCRTAPGRSTHAHPPCGDGDDALCPVRGRRGDARARGRHTPRRSGCGRDVAHH